MLPVDEKVQAALGERRVGLLLQPLPGGPGRQRPEADEPAAKKYKPEPGRKGAGKEKSKTQKRKDDKRLAAGVKDAFAKTTPRPKELIGHYTTTPEGENLCFNYNLSSCDQARPGERCSKGWHLCAKAACAKKPAKERCHAFKACRD